MFKKDNLKLGLVIGLLAPLLGMFGFYLWNFRSANFIDFVKYLAIEKRIITSMVTFSLFANAVFFTIYINGRRDKTARGIFIVTCIWAIAALILKLVY
jgi:hypothetical protein